MKKQDDIEDMLNWIWINSQMPKHNYKYQQPNEQDKKKNKRKHISV